MNITIDTPEYRALPVKDRLAIVYVTESLFFHATGPFRYSCPEELREFGESVRCEKIKVLSEIPDPFIYDIRGSSGSYEMNDHIISKVEKKFKDSVKAYNEYDIIIYAKESVKDKVVKYLTKKFDIDLDVEKIDPEDDPVNPFFDSWTGAERYCQENGIKVSLPDSVTEEIKKTKQVCFEVELENLKHKWGID